MPVNDPLDLIWLATARRLGLVVRRRADVFASTDGRGTLYLGRRADLDPDDHLAQMVFHEICHGLVNGPSSRDLPDWGFEPMETLDPREYVTLRVQYALAATRGLTGLMATTTAGRAYWDRLVDPVAPLDPSPEEAGFAAQTRETLALAVRGPWWPPVRDALDATAAVVAVTAPFAAAARQDLPWLFELDLRPMGGGEPGEAGA